MLHPINLYTLSRIRDPYCFGVVERNDSGSADRRQPRVHEMFSLRALAEELTALGVSVEEMDGFFFGYTIPHIGKEFDLLKITEKGCLNIELKSEEVSEEKIRDQLRRNRHYLRHLERETALYSVVAEPFACYRLGADGEARRVEPATLAASVRAFSGKHAEEIDGYFRAADYLVSPVSAPERFLRGEYFLTQEQEVIRKDVLRAASGREGCFLFHVSGRPGTGKTLLMFDTARALAAAGETLVIHCGRLQEGHDAIRQGVPGLRIVAAGDLAKDEDILARASFVLVDETQRMFPKQFAQICDAAREGGKLCLFFSDPSQILTESEREHDIAGLIAKLPPDAEYRLHTKIRTNREVYAFISRLMDRRIRPGVREEESRVRLSFAESVAEAKKLLAYYRGKGYVFINYSKSSTRPGPFDVYEEDVDTHRVIGQEFDRVVMLMDDSFYYDEDGVLQAVPHPNPNYLYPQLLYQGATRAREGLALILVECPALFRQVAEVLEGE